MSVPVHGGQRLALGVLITLYLMYWGRALIYT